MDSTTAPPPAAAPPPPPPPGTTTTTTRDAGSDPPRHDTNPGGETASTPPQTLETAAFYHLHRGFQQVLQQQQQSQTTGSGGTPPPSSSTTGTTTNGGVLVHFLDPNATTSISTRNPSGMASRQHSQQQHQQQHRRPSSLKERFAKVFETTHGNRLTQVPYQDARSKALQRIAHVHVNCRFLESQVDLLQTHEDEDDAWGGGTGGSSSSNAWHSRPYCYVYFVTGCASVEEYRTKIKPAIQVFLSQLDDLAQRQAMQLSTGGGGVDEAPTPAFLLLYCPTRTPGSPPLLPATHATTTASSTAFSDATGASPSAADEMGAAAAQRLASLSQAFRPRTSFTTTTDPTADAASEVGSDTAATSTVASASSTGDGSTPSSSSFDPSSVLTKVEKEVARRLAADFPQGTVATMSTLANDYHSFVSYGNNTTLQSALYDLERHEWALVLAALSKTVVQGFEAICQGLWRALRTMNQQAPAQQQQQASYYAQQQQQQQAQRGPPYGNNDRMGHYFLIKESLAFTYQQMNLPAEALLQYNELRAFLPDLKKVHLYQFPPPPIEAQQEQDVLAGISGVRSNVPPPTAPIMPLPTPIWQVSSVPQSITTSLRDRIRTLQYPDYYRFASFVELYLWERETALLFQMGHTVQVMNRTLQFCMALWDYETKQLSQTTTAKDHAIAVQELQEWAFGFCWDVRRAAHDYLAWLHHQQQQSLMLNKNSSHSQTSQSPQSFRVSTMELFGRQLSELLAFGRTRLVHLEQLKGIQTSPPRTQYQDIADAWEPWSASSSSSSATSSGDGESTAPSTASRSLLMNGQAFVTKAFDKEGQDYWTLYMDAMKVLIHVNTVCGRQRSAARFTMELVDLHLQQGQVAQAAQALQTVAKVYGRDGWGACHFLVHFRLAGFRRRGTGDETTPQDTTRSGGVSPGEYLATLVHCFSRYSDGSSNSVAPQKALELLCQDFEAVMAVLSSSQEEQDSSASGTTSTAGLYTNSPIFDVGFKFPDAKKRKLFATQRKLPRKVFSVGETVKITIGINSHLPREIGGIALSASLVPHKAYLAAQKQKRSVPPEDVFHTIELPEQVVFRPGENQFELQWTPMISGQFVLSQVTVGYKSANFVFSNDKMRELGFWLDILPVEPSQSLSVTPLFLIPGHKQRLQIEFRSGKDHVEEGELNLVCSPGLVLLPSDEEEKAEEEKSEWIKSWKCPLKECPRGGGQTFSVMVCGDTSGDDTDSVVGAPSVQVKVATKFRHGNQDQKELFNENNESASAHFQHEIESIVPTIANSALTVEHVSLNPYSDSKAILSVAAKCHVPAPFVLKSWNLEPPSYLKYTQDPANDWNAASKDTSLIDGESISFAFDCTTVSSAIDQTSNSPKMEHPVLVAELEDEHGGTFHEKLQLRLKKPTALMAMAKLQHVRQLNVRVKSSGTTGVVGVPVQFTYAIDTSALTSWEGQIYFTLDTNNTSWLIIGPTKGVVSPDESNDWHLSFDAIPTGPGTLSKMPSVTFTFEGGGLEKSYAISLPVVLLPGAETFHSDLQKKHSVVAFPVASGSLAEF